MPTNTPAIHFDGHPRYLGALPPQPVQPLPRFAAARVVLPSTQWQEIDLSAFGAPILDQDGQNSCFPAGTPILMADGSERPIEDVGVGNEVVTHEGRVRKVVAVSARSYTGEMRQLTVKGWNYPLQATADHPIAVIRNSSPRAQYAGFVDGGLEWRTAKEVRERDYVILSRGLPFQHGPECLDVRDFIGEEMWIDEEAGRCRLAQSERNHTIPLQIALTPRFARLVGFFLAEGSYRKAGYRLPLGLCFSFHRQEKEFHRFVVEALEELFECHPELKTHDRKPLCTDVECMNSTLARFFLALCGERAYGKFVHPVFFQAPLEIRLALLNGWLSGDGSHAPVRTKTCKGKTRNAIQSDGVTASERLHRGMFRLALSCGLRPGASIRNQEDHQTCPSRNLVFYSSDVLSVFPEQKAEVARLGIKLQARRSSRLHPLGFLSRVRSAISFWVTNKTVYNLEVEEDHSYVANGLVVHNCVGHGAATAATIAWLQKGEALIRFSPGFIYAQINNNRDEGAVVANAMTELLSTGSCSEEEVPEGIIYQQQIPRSAYTTAARYKLAVAYHCGSWEEVCTALSLGYPVVGGWLLGQNFMNPGPSAVVPVPDRVVGGHCLCLVGLRRINEAWLCKLQNSWGQRWGQGGWGFMGQDFFNYTARQYGQVDCFAVQAMAEDPQEQPGPVAA